MFISTKEKELPFYPPDELYERVMQLGAQGHSELGMAYALGVSPIDFHSWKFLPQYLGLRNAIQIGIQSATDQVRQSLYKRACGYRTSIEKIITKWENGEQKTVVDSKCEKEVPPSVPAMNLWLKLYAVEEPAPRRRPGEKRISDILDQLNADCDRRFAGYEKMLGPNWRDTVFASEEAYLEAFDRLRRENPGDNFGAFPDPPEEEQT